MTTLSNAPSQADERQLDADVIVIGAGPAGMSAAIELASIGREVIVLDMQQAPGGQIFRALEANIRARPATDAMLSALGPTYLAGEALIGRFRQTSGIDYRPETTVWDLRADGTVGWLMGESAGYLRASHVVVASGAMERPTPFEGWTLPGVMTAGAVQTLIKAGRLKPQGRIVLAGTGPLIFLLADQLRRLGVRPALVARTDRFADKLAALPHLRVPAVVPLIKGLSWLVRLRLAGIPMMAGITRLQARGAGQVEAVSLTGNGRTVDVPCDLLVVHDGIVPTIDLAHGAGLALEWRAGDASWQPRTAENGHAEMAPGAALTEGPCRIWVSGDARRIGGGDAAIAHGRHVAQAIISASDSSTAGALKQTASDVRETLASRPFIDKAFPPGLAAAAPDDETIVCRCEEISAGELRAEIRGGRHDMNSIRGVLRCGMGACQGRSCAITLARLLAEVDASPVAPAPFRSRPPVRPLPLVALAGLTGFDFDLAQIQSLDDKPEAAIPDDVDA